MKAVAEFLLISLGMIAWVMLSSGVTLNLTVPTVHILQIVR